MFLPCPSTKAVELRGAHSPLVDDAEVILSMVVKSRSCPQSLAVRVSLLSLSPVPETEPLGIAAN